MNTLKIYRLLRATVVAIAALGVTLAGSPAFAEADHQNAGKSVPVVSVGPQYDTTHVYVSNQDIDAFVDSFVATFGGKASPRAVFTVTPTPSKTASQYVQTPVGMLSVFAFQTPVPYPFGSERTGYLVTDMDKAVRAARAAGADVIVDTFDDPIGKDAVIQWPGGLYMQLYWHTKAPSYGPLEAAPDNRVYVSAQAADNFTKRFVRFSHGKVVSDNRRADGGEIGRPGDTIRRVRIASGFGNMLVFVTDGKLPYPYGRETTGYQVADLDATLTKAQGVGVKVLVPASSMIEGRSAVVEFPGGYVAEIHEAKK
ncbi:VOC family protein [Paraburkholderia kirstenboschensis]|jgi:predicted enzyme related to lactoylglutathione lyase|uniref:Glyoxalase n=1 Tax=Paraburkholderia kirstenboschensis TaxID=1245436 RepID=A0ABZ0E8G4_9BURK|nr:glyoxalase [Paraburkholderia kirstenboschensis]WOD13486.1 glyoxalase [Paraburkholderia kirstenboschensis]